LRRRAGFAHSCFTFGNESLVQKAITDGSDVPPGALIALVQKGLQFLEIETSLQSSASGTGNQIPLTDTDRSLAKAFLPGADAKSAKKNTAATGVAPMDSDDALLIQHDEVSLLVGHGHVLGVVLERARDERVRFVKLVAIRLHDGCSRLGLRLKLNEGEAAGTRGVTR
jgi:hypothetical protein